MILRWMPLIFLMLSSAAHAAIDLSAYELTEKEIALIERLEARGIDHQVLHDYAASLVRNRNRPPVYVPEHTLDDLMKVMAWAEGGAFYAFAKEAGVAFDQPAYMAACPHPQLFFFGKATGTAHLRLDVMSGYYNAAYGLQQAFARNPAEFQDYYLEAARRSGMSVFIRVLP